MKNAYAISSLSQQMVKVCEQIDSLAMGVQDTEQGLEIWAIPTRICFWMNWSISRCSRSN